jgi:hypothetical protein
MKGVTVSRRRLVENGLKILAVASHGCRNKVNVKMYQGFLSISTLPKFCTRRILDVQNFNQSMNVTPISFESCFDFIPD